MKSWICSPSLIVAAGWLLTAFCILPADAEQTLNLRPRSQSPTAPDSGRFHRTEDSVQWAAEQTAIIVCDMWDVHHSYRAAKRGREIAPRLNAVVTRLRESGATVIHAPSDCMAFYEEHPARRRAMTVPAAKEYPQAIDQWCHQIPQEEATVYPLDQSDGGVDDTAEELSAWHAKLRQQGLEPRRPWTRQTDLLTIDPNVDFISDSGTEIWNILAATQVTNVILAGVHTNMCVLGRPFGLRRMVLGGKNVVLLRDLTDTMYNPAMPPYVSHFTGTDLIVDHIERFVCPTIASDQILSGSPFRFADDQRVRLAMLIGEDEYQTEKTLPKFARQQLGHDYRVDLIFADEDQPNLFPGIERVATADALLISVRRRTPPPAQLKVVRDFASCSKPIIGIRTANHAFLLRNKQPSEGFADWQSVDADLFGGSYSNHYSNKLSTTVSLVAAGQKHPITEGLPEQLFVSPGSLYVCSPLADQAEPLMLGRVEGHPAEPIAWTFTRPDGGWSFYTSLGHPQDFEESTFVTVLQRAIDWTANQTGAP